MGSYDVKPWLPSLHMSSYISIRITKNQRIPVQVRTPSFRDHQSMCDKKEGTECPKSYRKSVLHLHRYRFAVYLGTLSI